MSRLDFWVNFGEYLGNDLKDDMTDIEKARLWGYIEAVSDYGIWKDGTQSVGCMSVSIHDAVRRKAKEMGVLK